MSTVNDMSNPAKVPERLSRWFALEFPDGSLDHEGSGETIELRLYRTKRDAEVAKLVYIEEYEPPHPRVSAITLS